ncbi:MAG: ABC transporter ATP-binding protein [Proteobacteria bacterium]|nr:ABC transporter ATP-binding protein [Pseudomonadota bacterium]
MNSIVLRDISVRFGNVDALRGVTVELRRGEVVMMVGPNGAGKSTLTRVLLGLIQPTAGSLVVDGRAATVDNTFKRELGYLPEAVAFSDNLSGRQVLRFFARARGIGRREVDAALARVSLSAAAQRAVRGYSKGMRQRLGLAVAILAQPPLLILDEPTGGLDGEGVALLASLIEEWRTAGRMVLLSSHHLDVLEQQVDRMVVLRQGKLIAAGTPRQLRERVALRHQVTFALTSSHGASHDDYAAALGQFGPVTTQTDQMTVEVLPERMLEVTSIHPRFPGLVTGLAVEPPSLEMVYRRLLAEETQP